jgi:hypothetical protein
MPDLKQDAIAAMDLLFRNFTVYFGEDIPGEHYEILQAAWMHILRDIKSIESLIPRANQFATLRKNLRAFRNYLRQTIEVAIFKNPTGPK